MAEHEDEVPRIVAVAWGVAAFPQKGPKRVLSHEGIVDAAIEIADAEGLSAVTMQRVAQVFGYTTMALYRYIATKDELHQLMLDAALSGGELGGIDTDDWRAGFSQWAGLILDAYRRHPWALDIGVRQQSLVMPNQMAVADAALRALRPLPISHAERIVLLLAASVFVRGYAETMLQIERTGGTIGEATKDMIREVGTVTRFPDLRPVIESGEYFGDVPEGGVEVEGEDFEMGLAWLLDGFERSIEGRDAAPERAQELTPDERLELAETELANAVARRKATERRVKELSKAEAAAHKARDAARELAKAARRA